MELTQGFQTVLPDSVRARYEVREVRNAAAILSATDSAAFADILEVLEEFRLSAAHLLLPGKNEGLVAKQLNLAMRERGWREARVDTEVQHTLVKFPFAGAEPRETTSWLEQLDPQSWEGYKADWVKGRVAGDCEWNAKDGNLDRDFASYRSLYEAGFIDGAVLVTRTQDDLWTLEASLLEELLQVGAGRAAEAMGYPASDFQSAIDRIHKLRSAPRPGRGAKESRLGTTTSTNLGKLEQRLRRGDGGGCPILVIAICSRTFDGLHLLDGPLPEVSPDIAAMAQLEEDATEDE